MKPTAAWTTLAAVAVLAAGCGEETSESAPSTETTAQVEQAPAPSCQRGGKALTAALRSSLRHGVGMERASTVEFDGASDSPLVGFRRGTYAVAAKLTGPGMDGQVAVWAVSADMVRTGGGLAIGADSVTREFSELGSAAENGSPAADFAGSVADSEAGRRAVDCAGG